MTTTTKNIRVRAILTGSVFLTSAWETFYVKPGKLDRAQPATFADVISAGGHMNLPEGREAWAMDPSDTSRAGRWLPVEFLP